MFCAKCGKENGDGNKFCVGCGETLSQNVQDSSQEQGHVQQAQSQNFQQNNVGQ